ncbi:MAG: orotidine-5'-phosphate decarboxylase [bacterium]|nr:orotidine-5'-phosphate decarboxylase [bacterium]
MSFIDDLQDKSKQSKSIVCMGMDPNLEKIPVKGSVENRIVEFYTQILKAVVREDAVPGIVKPNYSFYAQYGFPGLKALKKIIDAYKEQGILVILDAKRADIGKTSEASARETFDFWGADATTVAPYMGSDSVEPFVKYCEKGKGVYVLVRTSNVGASDLQELTSGGEKIYMKTAKKLVEWYKPGVGAVVGATAPKELQEISKFFKESGKEVPFLIPGVGAQGGTASEVVDAIKQSGNRLEIHRINSSSSINYAYQKTGTRDYAQAAADAIKELNKEIAL